MVKPSSKKINEIFLNNIKNNIKNLFLLKLIGFKYLNYAKKINRFF